MADLSKVFTQDLTYTGPGERDPLTGEEEPGAAVGFRGRYVERAGWVRNSLGAWIQEGGQALVPADLEPELGGEIEGREVQGVEAMRDKTQLLGYRVFLK